MISAVLIYTITMNDSQAKDTESKAQTRPETTTKMIVTIKAPQEMDAIGTL